MADRYTLGTLDCTQNVCKRLDLETPNQLPPTSAQLSLPALALGVIDKPSRPLLGAVISVFWMKAISRLLDTIPNSWTEYLNHLKRMHHYELRLGRSMYNGRYVIVLRNERLGLIQSHNKLPVNWKVQQMKRFPPHSVASSEAGPA